MCFFADWDINWEALSAIGTLLAVVLALGTTVYIEVKDYRRRKVEVRSMASALHFEFEANRQAMLAEVKAFDATPPAILQPHPANRINGVYARGRLLTLSEGLKRARFSVLRSVAGRIALFDQGDAINLGMVVAAATAFEENQNLTEQDIHSMDDAHAQGLETSMRNWATTITNLLEPASLRMAEIAKIAPARE